MTGLFEKNLAVLAERDAETAARIMHEETFDDCRIITARSGAVTAAVRGVTLHSRFDPVSEACGFADRAFRLAEADRRTPAIFGFGLGYHVSESAQRCDELPVIEPDPKMLRLAFGLLDLSDVLPRVIFLTPADGGLADRRLLLAPHGPSVRLRRREYELWRAKLDAGPAGAAPAETAAELQSRLAEIPGAEEMLSQFADGQRITEEEFVEAARLRPGRLSTIGVYALVLGELTASGR
jgi:hypothetical protein